MRTEVTERIRSATLLRLHAAFTRSQWQGPLPTTKHDRPAEYVPLWWGPVVVVNPGDEIVLLPTLMGDLVDEVRPAPAGG